MKSYVTTKKKKPRKEITARFLFVGSKLMKNT